MDRTGIKFLGDGKWQERWSGLQGRRPWSKVPQAVDTATLEIRAVRSTSNSDDDSPVLPQLIGQLAAPPVTADGACESRRCHTALIGRNATAIIPIHKNGLPSKEDCPAARARNETLRATRHHGRVLWQRWIRYPGARPRCAVSQPAASAAPRETLTAEIQLRAALMSRVAALGTAECTLA